MPREGNPAGTGTGGIEATTHQEFKAFFFEKKKQKLLVTRLQPLRIGRGPNM
jgi:hypothetical protein